MGLLVPAFGPFIVDNVDPGCLHKHISDQEMIGPPRAHKKRVTALPPEEHHARRTPENRRAPRTRGTGPS